MLQGIIVIVIVLGAVAYLLSKFTGIFRAKAGKGGGCDNCQSH